MTDPINSGQRLIEVAFPLKQASLDSVHEKNVRHGHISTLHIWPARRPLAASRAAVIATLLSAPSTPEERKRMIERIGGTLITRIDTKKLNGKTVEIAREETEGGILHWGRESSPELDRIRQEIRNEFGGRAPRILDPFAGGGAIPFEAMRLGCDTSANDINPVAWFLLKCSLDYPQRFSRTKAPLPAVALSSFEFMEQFQKNTHKAKRVGNKKRAQNQTQLFEPADANLAWHVRAWGGWVLERVRRELAAYYPTQDSRETVAYLWARTLQCKNCRATVPLLKTRWLCKKERKRVLLRMSPDRRRAVMEFSVESDVPLDGSNATQRRERDRKLGQGTMSSSGVTCPCCGVVNSMEDIRLESQAARLGTVLTAVVVDGNNGKEYRRPSSSEVAAAIDAGKAVADVFSTVPFGLPTEPINTGSIRKGGVSVTRWGLKTWSDLYTPRQLLALGAFVRATREVKALCDDAGYDPAWTEAVVAYLALAVDRIADRGSALCHWDIGYEKITHTFTGYRLPISWDFVETNVIGDSTGSYAGQLEWIARFVEYSLDALAASPPVSLANESATQCMAGQFDAIVTDPPYYDAIPYADLMDFFYVWLRRTTSGLSGSIDAHFQLPVVAKWDHSSADGELIDDESRFDGDSKRSKAAYEDGMFRSFQACHSALRDAGRLIIVFANKQPDAWETLVSAIIRAGFVVDGSWPIQTEMGNRTRAQTSAALSSSVWLVCKKRPESARPGWDARVLEEMRERIHARLRDFWDAGIRGPDFVWAATGPAMEAYSRHPIVKKANEPGQAMDVSEFLRHVRRMVVDFVVGRVLSRDGGDEAVSGLDDVTTYYLLHRNDFGFDDAPAGACILYAVSCGLSDDELIDTHNLLARAGGKRDPAETDDDEGEDGSDEGQTSERSGSKMRLRKWEQRTRTSMGIDAEGRPAALIDQVHRLMHLWKGGDVNNVDEYLETRALKKSQVFHKLLQALIELAAEGSDERSLLESISNHIAAQPAKEQRQRVMFEP